MPMTTKNSDNARQSSEAKSNNMSAGTDGSVKYEKIAVLDNEVQAEALDALLTEIGIPHEMISYRDSAMDGLYQATRGWGHVEAPLDRAEDVKQALQSLTDEQGKA